MLYGFVLDTACIVQQTSCERTGACLLYDSDQFRYKMHGVTACIKMGALLVYVVGFLLSRRKDKMDEKKKQQNEGTKMTEKKDMIT